MISQAGWDPGEQMDVANVVFACAASPANVWVGAGAVVAVPGDGYVWMGDWDCRQGGFIWR